MAPPIEPSLLTVGDTCAGLVRADRLALLVDFESYFTAAKCALQKARTSITLLGWDFDPRTRLSTRRDLPSSTNVLGPFLNGLKRERPELEIRILIWAMALPIAAQHWFYPQRSGFWLDNGIRFHLDRTGPYGASRHEKILVVDDQVAFCGGGDFASDRLDTLDHLDGAPWRVSASGRAYPPRHDVMMIVDGAAARALGEHARERWREATGETVLAPNVDEKGGMTDGPWPDQIVPNARDVDVGIVHTIPAKAGREAVRQSQSLYLAAIRAARKLIYLENQYFTSPVIREALAERLRESRGPEIVMVCTKHAPSYFDHATMDSARDVFVHRLSHADKCGRFRAYAPHTENGQPIIVHSKLAIFDDRLLRLGSTNMNNRSFGYDTETDLAIEGDDGEPLSGMMSSFRTHLVTHYLGAKKDEFIHRASQGDSLIQAIEAADTGPRRRLMPYVPKRHGLIQRLVARWHLGDPMDTSDAWRPWRRRIKY